VLGHWVTLLHAKFIRPFVQNNKTDVANAHAICSAAYQPGMRTVAEKTENQQAVLGLHRMRSQLVKFPIEFLHEELCLEPEAIPALCTTPRLGVVSPPMNSVMPSMPSLPARAISAGSPSSMT
jgi:hypothetical protein